MTYPRTGYAQPPEEAPANDKASLISLNIRPPPEREEWDFVQSAHGGGRVLSHLSNVLVLRQKSASMARARRHAGARVGPLFHKPKLGAPIPRLMGVCPGS